MVAFTPGDTPNNVLAAVAAAAAAAVSHQFLSRGAFDGDTAALAPSFGLPFPGAPPLRLPLSSQTGASAGVGVGTVSPYKPAMSGGDGGAPLATQSLAPPAPPPPYGALLAGPPHPTAATAGTPAGAPHLPLSPPTLYRGTSSSGSGNVVRAPGSEAAATPAGSATTGASPPLATANAAAPFLLSAQLWGTPAQHPQAPSSFQPLPPPAASATAPTTTATTMATPGHDRLRSMMQLLGGPPPPAAATTPTADQAAYYLQSAGATPGALLPFPMAAGAGGGSTGSTVAPWSQPAVGILSQQQQQQRLAVQLGAAARSPYAALLVSNSTGGGGGGGVAGLTTGVAAAPAVPPSLAGLMASLSLGRNLAGVVPSVSGGGDSGAGASRQSPPLGSASAGTYYPRTRDASGSGDGGIVGSNSTSSISTINSGSGGSGGSAAGVAGAHFLKQTAAVGATGTMLPPVGPLTRAGTGGGGVEATPAATAAGGGGGGGLLVNPLLGAAMMAGLVSPREGLVAGPAAFKMPSATAMMFDQDVCYRCGQVCWRGGEGGKERRECAHGRCETMSCN